MRAIFTILFLYCFTAGAQNAWVTRVGGSPYVTSAAGNSRVSGLVTSGDINFILPADAVTSAGIFIGDSLITTLWSNVEMTAGTHTETWYGDYDVYGKAPAGTYVAKVLSNNLTYTPEGVIGNSSDSSHGSTLHHAFSGAIVGMAIVGTKIYAAWGFNERQPSIGRMFTNAPNRNTGLFPMDGSPDMSAYFVVADDSSYYIPGGDGLDINRTFTIAMKFLGDTFSHFSAGDTMKMKFGRTYPYAIDKMTAVGSYVTGATVQKTGPCYFTARKELNQIHVLNKYTGALVQNITIQGPTALAASGRSSLWVTNDNTTELTTGTPFSSGEYDDGMGTYTEAHAYDYDTSTIFGSNDVTAWLGKDFATPIIISKISVRQRSDAPGASPLGGMRFQGSNTTRTEGFTDLFTIPYSNRQYVYNDYSFNNSTPYRYYRLFADSIGIQIAELRMFGGNITTEKYTVAANGTLTATGIVLPGISAALAVAVTPDTSKVFVADGGDHAQIKVFSNSTGTLLRSFGRLGGYRTKTLIEDTAFAFFSHILYGGETSMITFAPDGSFWVADPGNRQVKHFDSSFHFIERIMNQGKTYYVYGDPNDSTAILNDYILFKIDYSKPLSPTNGSWKDTHNYGYGLTYEYPRYLTTLSNGKKYAFLVNTTTGRNQMIELTDSVIRYTGLTFEGNNVLYADGSVWQQVATDIGDSAYWQNKTITSFAGANPIYDHDWNRIATLPDTVKIDDAIQKGGGLTQANVTPGGMVISFVKDKPNFSTKLGSGYHLAGIRGRRVIFRTAYSTPPNYAGGFPKHGAFDQGNYVIYAGSEAHSLGRLSFWGYHGEFWKLAQTNIFNVYDSCGLMAGQFGLTAENLVEESPPGMAGNALTWCLQKIGNDIYLYHGDESYRGGPYRWKISGISTVQVNTYPLSITGTAARPSAPGLDMFNGLVWNSVVPPDSLGWKLSDSIVAPTGTLIESIRPTDATFYMFSKVTRVDSVRRDLGNINSSTWKLSGSVIHPDGDAMWRSDGAECYFEIIDSNLRVIARFSREIKHPWKYIYLNDTKVLDSCMTGLNDAIDVYGRQLRGFEISAAGGNITMKLGTHAGSAPDYNVTTPILDGASLWQRPRYFRIRYKTVGLNNSGYRTGFTGLNMLY